MAIALGCPCGASLSVPDALAGVKRPCPSCGELLAVPGGEAVSRPRRPVDRVRCACGLTFARARSDGECPACGRLVPQDAGA